MLPLISEKTLSMELVPGTQKAGTAALGDTQEMVSAE